VPLITCKVVLGKRWVAIGEVTVSWKVTIRRNKGVNKPRLELAYLTEESFKYAIVLVGFKPMLVTSPRPCNAMVTPRTTILERVQDLLALKYLLK
jgi:hypothetical protein